MKKSMNRHGAQRLRWLQGPAGRLLLAILRIKKWAGHKKITNKVNFSI